MKTVNLHYPIDHLKASWLASNALLGELPQWLSKARQEGLEHLMQGLPNRKSERWKYTSLQPVARSPWKIPTKPGEVQWEGVASNFVKDAIRVVFIDGVLDSTNSELTGVKGLSLRALPADVEFPKSHSFGDDVTSKIASDDVVEALNRAFMYHGLLVTLEDGVSLQRPIQFVFVQTSAKQVFLSVPRVVICCGRDSKVELVEYHCAQPGTQYLHAPVVQVAVAQNATCHHARVSVDAAGGYHLAKTQVQLAKGADYRNFCGAFAGGLVRHDLSVRLKEGGAHASLCASYLGKNKDHIDFLTELDHEVAHTTSTQLYKGILSDAARAVFNGKVFVRKNAHSVSANQLNKNLLLSEHAEIDSKPQLEIDNDDVKCSHGATAGRLRAEELFYLQSRGISKKDATKLLLNAFLTEPAKLLQASQDVETFILKSMQDSLSEVCDGL